MMDKAAFFCQAIRHFSSAKITLHALKHSLPDAKVCEDVVEDVLGADFAGDGGEVVEGLA